MSAADDGHKPPAPGDEEIELPLSTDWKPGPSGNDGGFRRISEAAPLPCAAPAPDPAPESGGGDPRDSQSLRLAPRPVNPSPSLTVTRKDVNKKQCPKCGFLNANYFNCDRCGLVFSLWRPEMERAEYAEVPEPVLLRARELWRAVVDAEPGAAREAAVTVFHEYCQNEGAESFAAVRYRIWMGSHPNDEAVRRGQQRIISRAQMMLPQQATRKRQQIGAGGLFLALLVTLVITAILTYFFLDFFGPRR